MTLTGIVAFLRENDLVFLGFEIEATVFHAYKRRFPDDPAATNLGEPVIKVYDTKICGTAHKQRW